MKWVLRLIGTIATVDDILERLKRIEAEIEVIKRRKPMAVMMLDEQDSYDATTPRRIGDDADG